MRLRPSVELRSSHLRSSSVGAHPYTFFARSCVGRHGTDVAFGRGRPKLVTSPARRRLIVGQARTNGQFHEARTLGSRRRHSEASVYTPALDLIAWPSDLIAWPSPAAMPVTERGWWTVTASRSADRVQKGTD